MFNSHNLLIKGVLIYYQIVGKVDHFKGLRFTCQGLCSREWLFYWVNNFTLSVTLCYLSLSVYIHAKVCVGTFFCNLNKCSHCSRISELSVDIPALSLCHGNYAYAWIFHYISFKTFTLLFLGMFCFSENCATSKSVLHEPNSAPKRTNRPPQR